MPSRAVCSCLKIRWAEQQKASGCFVFYLGLMWFRHCICFLSWVQNYNLFLFGTNFYAPVCCLKFGWQILQRLIRRHIYASILINTPQRKNGSKYFGSFEIMVKHFFKDTMFKLKTLIWEIYWIKSHSIEAFFKQRISHCFI